MKGRTMFGIEAFLILMLLRIILPMAMLLLVGEWERRRESRYVL